MAAPIIKALVIRTCPGRCGSGCCLCTIHSLLGFQRPKSHVSSVADRNSGNHTGANHCCIAWPGIPSQHGNSCAHLEQPQELRRGDRCSQSHFMYTEHACRLPTAICLRSASQSPDSACKSICYPLQLVAPLHAHDQQCTDGSFLCSQNSYANPLRCKPRRFPLPKLYGPVVSHAHQCNSSYHSYQLLLIQECRSDHQSSWSSVLLPRAAIASSSRKGTRSKTKKHIKHIRHCGTASLLRLTGMPPHHP